MVKNAFQPRAFLVSYYTMFTVHVICHKVKKMFENKIGCFTDNADFLNISCEIVKMGKISNDQCVIKAGFHIDMTTVKVK